MDSSPPLRRSARLQEKASKEKSPAKEPETLYPTPDPKNAHANESPKTNTENKPSLSKIGAEKSHAIKPANTSPLLIDIPRIISARSSSLFHQLPTEMLEMILLEVETLLVSG